MPVSFSLSAASRLQLPTAGDALRVGFEYLIGQTASTLTAGQVPAAAGRTHRSGRLLPAPSLVPQDAELVCGLWSGAAPAHPPAQPGRVSELQQGAFAQLLAAFELRSDVPFPGQGNGLGAEAQAASR